MVAAADRSGSTSRLEESAREGPTTVSRVAAMSAIALVILLPLIDLGQVALFPEYGGQVGLATIATALTVPLTLRHVIYGLRAEHPPAATITLALLAITNVGAALIVGPPWLLNFAWLAVSVLVALRGRTAVVLFFATILASGAFVGASPVTSSAYVVTSVAWRSVTVFVLIWLVAAHRQLDAARDEVSDRAIVRERTRIDDDLRTTIRPALAGIVERGTRTLAVLDRDSGGAIDELHALVDDARSALSDARRLVAGYRGVSVGAELDAARTLLDAAGVTSRLVVTDNRLLDSTDPGSRSAVRSAIALAFRDELLSRCVIEITRGEAGALRVLVSPDSAPDVDPRPGMPAPRETRRP